MCKVTAMLPPRNVRGIISYEPSINYGVLGTSLGPATNVGWAPLITGFSITYLMSW